MIVILCCRTANLGSGKMVCQDIDCSSSHNGRIGRKISRASKARSACQEKEGLVAPWGRAIAWPTLIAPLGRAQTSSHRLTCRENELLRCETPGGAPLEWMSRTRVRSPSSSSPSTYAEDARSRPRRYQERGRGVAERGDATGLRSCALIKYLFGRGATGYARPGLGMQRQLRGRVANLCLTCCQPYRQPYRCKRAG